MNKNIDEKLINKDKYQIFVCASPASFPINFAKHGWFVLNKKGLISRWEVLHFKIKVNKGFNYLHLNNRAPFLGFNIIYPFKFLFWKAEVLGYIEGDENSIVKQVIDFIEKSKENYPYCDKYSFLGPNSNTYVKWILDKYPQFGIELSSGFVGKGFNVK